MVIKTDGNSRYIKSFHSFAHHMEETDVKDRIRQVAHDLVMQYSIRSVSMDDIAGKLGMSKKTIYQYYRDKEELVDDVVVSLLMHNQCTCTADRKKADNAVHEIFLAMHMVAEMLQCMNPSIIYDMQKYHPAVFEKFLKHKNDFLHNMMRQNIERGIAEELYRPEINIEIMAKFRVDSIFLPFNPDFMRNLKASLVDIEKEIIVNYVYGLVTPKGYKLVQKYQAQMAKIKK